LSGIVNGLTAAQWAEQMLASYRALNPEQAPWFDGAGAFAQTELQERLAPGGYLNDTFGPSGQNKTTCDFVYLLYTTGNIVSRPITKTGATIRWNIDGTIYNQNDLPSHTKGAGAGVVTLSSTDGWSGVIEFRIFINSFSGNCPLFVFPNVATFRIEVNSFSGNCPDFAFPNLAVFWIQANSFSGIVAGTISFVAGTSNLKTIEAQVNNLPQADIDRLLAAYHTHRAYYAGLAGNLTFNLSGAGNAAPSVTGLAHRQEIIDAFVAAGKTAAITVNELPALQIIQPSSWPSVQQYLVSIHPDTPTETATTFGDLSGSGKWFGGVLAPNGIIYGIPHNSTSILRIDPSNDSITTFGDLSGSGKWAGGILAPNGIIYGIPENSTSILRIDTNVSILSNVAQSGYFNKF
jgi:hypothetical protein